ncbi:MAG: hypothetical protein ACT4PI_12990 [Actinomycetota bacterium]
MSERQRRPPRGPDGGDWTEPPPFRPREDLIEYLDSDTRGIPKKERRVWHELWKPRRRTKSAD